MSSRPVVLIYWLLNREHDKHLQIRQLLFGSYFKSELIVLGSQRDKDSRDNSKSSGTLCIAASTGSGSTRGRLEIQDRKMSDQISRIENTGPKNARPENVERKMQAWKMRDQVHSVNRIAKTTKIS